MGIVEIALKIAYQHVDDAVELLMSGDQKKAIVLLRQILPKEYRHTFEKPKGN